MLSCELATFCILYSAHKKLHNTCCILYILYTVCCTLHTVLCTENPSSRARRSHWPLAISAEGAALAQERTFAHSKGGRTQSSVASGQWRRPGGASCSGSCNGSCNRNGNGSHTLSKTLLDTKSVARKYLVENGEKRSLLACFFGPFLSNSQRAAKMKLLPQTSLLHLLLLRHRSFKLKLTSELPFGRHFFFFFFLQQQRPIPKKRQRRTRERKETR